MRMMLLATLICMAANLGVTPRSAQAAEMHLGLYDGTATISIIGRIEPGDAAKFMEALHQGVAERGFVSLVNIYSPGGAVDDAIEIGNVISTLSITTSVPFLKDESTGDHECRYRETGATSDTVVDRNFSRGTGERDCTCMSACFLIWAAGAERFGHFIGIHRTYFRPESFAASSFRDARERYSTARLRVEDYLRRMNVPDLVIDTMYSVSSDQIEPLEEQFIELLRADPALEEYLNARCQDLFIAQRDADRLADRLERIVDPTLEQVTERAEAILASVNAGQALFECQREVRRVIFTEAWEENYASAGEPPQRNKN